MGPGGVEPPTSRLSGVRSNHLSYEPLFEAQGQSSAIQLGCDRNGSSDCCPLMADSCLTGKGNEDGGVTCLCYEAICTL